MSWRTAAARVTGLSVVSGKQSQVESDLAEEIQAHIDLDTEENIGRGMAPEAARRAALLEFGNPSLVREQAAALWTFAADESFFQDIRFGLRLFRRTSLLTVMTVPVIA